MEAEHYAVDVSSDGEQARAMAGELDFDLVVLDLNLPRIGGLITGREAAYRYLTDSVALFPDAHEFKTAMVEAGFSNVGYLTMNGGIVCVHTGVRP